MLSLVELERRAAALRALDEAGWARWRRGARVTAPGGAGTRAAPAGEMGRLCAEGQRLLAEGARLARAAARGRVEPAAHERLRAALRVHGAALRRLRRVPAPEPGRSTGPDQEAKHRSGLSAGGVRPSPLAGRLAHAPARPGLHCPAPAP
jgi:hypothetical protein